MDYGRQINTNIQLCWGGTMIRYALRRGAMALCLVLLAVGVCAAKDVGQIISFKAGVTAQRDGQPVALGMKSPVGDHDVLTTDATGRAQVLFDDDTTVSLASNTSLKLETVVAEGANPAFKARLGQGVARFITGKIVEKNPDGFSVVTPDATVGIRGTIFAVKVGDGTTTVFVTNTTKQVFVNGVLVPTGFKMSLPQGTLAPMTPADHNFVSGSVAAGGASSGGLAQLAPPTQGAGGAITPTTLGQTQFGAQSLGDGFRQLDNANVSGSMYSSDMNTGSFSFNVNLASGAVSNGVMNTTEFNVLTGGSGNISGSSLKVNNFANYSFVGSMTGTASATSGRLLVGGAYEIKSTYDNSTIGSGSFTGSSR